MRRIKAYQWKPINKNQLFLFVGYYAAFSNITAAVILGITAAV